MAVLVINRQRGTAFNLAAVEAFAVQACEVCDVDFDPLEITLVSDRRMAALHRQFLQIRGTTDVITFEHGEIVICAAVAARAASEHGERLERELCRYIMHGLLHLCGYDDAAPAARRTMWRAQEKLLGCLWPPDAGARTNVRKRVPRR